MHARPKYKMGQEVWIRAKFGFATDVAVCVTVRQYHGKETSLVSMAHEDVAVPMKDGVDGGPVFSQKVIDKTEEQPDSKPRLPVGVSVLITNGDAVLLGERINNTASGLLSTPGGRVELDEDILTCAVRETLEETGLSLTKTSLSVIGWREHFRFGQHYIMFYVHALHSSGTLENREPNKCKGWKWYRIADVKAESTTEPLDILRRLSKEGVQEELRVALKAVRKEFNEMGIAGRPMWDWLSNGTDQMVRAALDELSEGVGGT